jgi:sugar/nucleoside kinase (ribokinase family)
VDAFIKLKEAHVHCKLDHAECEICMAYGDKIPYESVTVCNAVGNSPNAAVAASRLGLKSALVTNLGADIYGQDCIASLKKDGVDDLFVHRHENKKTNYHYVLWYGADRTILIKHEDYDRVWPEIGTPGWLYLSSLGENTEKYHEAIADYLEQNKGVRLAFQPGTYQIRAGTTALARLYQRTEVFFCNKEEAQKILNLGESEIKPLLTGLRALGPKIAVISDGPRGAYASDGEHIWEIPIYPDPKAPFDRTGAGDAFSSTVTTALALGKSLPEALAWGPINSMSVVQYVGAQEGLLSRAKLEQYLSEAPSNYKPEKI